MNSKYTFELLKNISRITQIDITTFTVPRRGPEIEAGSCFGMRVRQAAMLPRFLKAFFALPCAEDRHRIILIMDAITSRANGASVEKALQAKSLR